ncbi:MAG: glycoside hydrolase [Calditrichaeota bacterium]|nr:glycoside hydrolase [Calditrichota bacterium]
MKTNKLYLGILWHHHQPYYKDARGVYHMPWVRFHGMKDYLDLLSMIRQFPDIRQNINLVPSLLTQIEDYAHRDARDNIWLLTEKPAEKLTEEDKNEILNNFFLANVETMIKPYPRYFELYTRLRSDSRYLSATERTRIFSTQEYRDLQVWYNLIWVGMISRQKPALQKLFRKGRNFTEKDKRTLLQEALAILQQIVPAHKKAWEEGQIELSTTPFYHPILPLLIDNQVARQSDPAVRLPAGGFAHPEDAEWQLETGLEYFEQLFGRRPEGIWPAEGAVSEAAAAMIARHGIRWIATDEGILARTLGVHFEPHKIYSPYRFVQRNQAVAIFFRDHYLSDAIGFVYSNWDAEKAVDDFMTRLYAIRNRIAQKAGEEALAHHMVTVILDGENCWEYYPNYGKDFLQTLFSRLSDDPYIQTITFSEFLRQQQTLPELRKLFPGSWINSNFNIWIGSEEDNRAWELLKRTRDFLTEKEKEVLLPPEVLEEAWQQIYIAEGSDWCWWYGDEHSSSQDMEFDQLYREHLMRVYELVGEDVPAEYYQTIKKSHFDRFKSIRPLNFIHPQIDGRDTYFYEWVGAAIYEGTKAPQTAMHQVSRIIERLYVGFDPDHLYLRIDFHDRPDPMLEFVLSIKMPKQLAVVISPLRGIMEKYEMREEKYERELLEPTFKLNQILEAAIPFRALEVQAGEKLGIQLHIKQNNQLVEKFPHINIIELEVPDENFELREWSV